MSAGLTIPSHRRRASNISRVCRGAAVLVGASPAAYAAGAEHISWTYYLPGVAAILIPAVLVGFALSDVRLGRFAALGATLWVLDWCWMSYERGLDGAIERTSGYVLLMIFFSLPIMIGWLVGRVWHRRARLAIPNAELREG